jgi:hypothetical protein
MQLPEEVQKQECWPDSGREPDQRRGDRRRLADVFTNRDDAGAERAAAVAEICLPATDRLFPQRLFQRRIDRCELGAEVGADTIDGGQDHDTEAGCDQAIFDRGRAGLIAQES